DTASLLVQHAIHSARERLWVTSPYFVPDQGVQDALRLASMRGVDVRIMIPERPDHLLVFLSAFSFLPDMLRAGVKVYRYQPGFLHQKVMLIDDAAASVGTVNLDNRSFRLNFEITAFLPDRLFAAQVRLMLEKDFANCRRIGLDEITSRPLWRKLLSRAAYLLAPIQ
ncbi:MAG: phospholipase D-like domain-containing protein, partial [Pseudomonadota bacterium]